MSEIDFHSDFEMQIQNSIGNRPRLKRRLNDFLSKVNLTYLTNDKLTMEKQELAKKLEACLLDNALLSIRNEALESKDKLKDFQIEERDLHLCNTEKIANSGTFKLNIRNKSMLNSDQMMKMFNMEDAECEIEYFVNLFKNSEHLLQEIQNACLTETPLKIDEIALKSEEKYYTLAGEYFNYHNKPMFLFVIHDVTTVKKSYIEVEAALLNLDFYKSVIDQTLILSIFNTEGKIIETNDNFMKFSGYSKDEILGKPHDFLRAKDFDENFNNDLWEKVKSGDNWNGILKNLSKSGEVTYVYSTVIPYIKNERIENYISVKFDITDRYLANQKLDNQRIFYETILNNLPLDFVVFNQKLEYLYVNPMAIANPEVREFMIGKTDYDYCAQYGKDISIAHQRSEMFQRVMELKLTEEYTQKVDSKDGQTKFILRKMFPFLNANENLEYMLGVGVDITEKTEQSLKIEAALVEKEALLGEVNHRVKNNLSLINGLIEMQMSKFGDTYGIKNEFQEIQNRISVMSLIHEKLYKSNNFANIDLRDYLVDLITYLAKFFDKNQKCKIEFDMEDVFTTTKLTVPIGLIINELVTNSFKHAFLGNENPKISIKLTAKDDVIELSVSDNGLGMKEEIEQIKSKSLGFRLIHIFIKQLKAESIFNTENGFSLVLRFKNNHQVQLPK